MRLPKTSVWRKSAWSTNEKNGAWSLTLSFSMLIHLWVARMTERHMHYDGWQCCFVAVHNGSVQWERLGLDSLRLLMPVLLSQHHRLVSVTNRGALLSGLMSSGPQRTRTFNELSFSKDVDSVSLFIWIFIFVLIRLWFI